MSGNRTVIEELLARSTEDWVFDDHICDAAIGHCQVSDWESVRAMALGIALELLMSGYVYPVLWEENPWARERTVAAKWDGYPWPVIERLQRSWAAKSEPDGFSDIVWFGPTQKGYERGIEILRREGKRPSPPPGPAGATGDAPTK